MNTQHLQSPAFYRIGAISKLSGIPVPTFASASETPLAVAAIRSFNTLAQAAAR